MNHLETSGARGSADLPNRSEPDRREVDELIRRAHEHPLGVSFLLQGMHDSVAATFGVHAFVVDEARERLGDRAPIGD